MKATWIRKFEENIPASVFRRLWNLYRPFRAAGIHIDEMSDDFRYIRVHMSMHWFNMNYVGTHFGGSIYAMTDPFYMLMLLRNLGRDFVVWDKAAKIDFKKPGKGTIRAEFKFTAEEIEDIRRRALAAENGKLVFDRPVTVLNEEGEVVAEVVKTLYVRAKQYVTNKEST